MINLPLRKLGKEGPLVSSIGLGCMNLSYDLENEEEKETQILTLLNRAIDIGCTFWDTAAIYGLGQNETILSAILKERRNEVFLCTKFGLEFNEETKQVKASGSRDHIIKSCDNSLKRLNVDYIDLFYMHRMDPETPIEDTIGTLKELIHQNKIRYIGLSECSAKTLRRAHAVHPITAVEVEYSLITTDIERNELLNTCRELGVAIVAYSPLGRGFLTKKLNKETLKEHELNCIPRYQGSNLDHNLQLIDELEKLCEKYKCSLSQLCLGWLLQQGDDIIPIPGAVRMGYFMENVATINISFPKDFNKEVRDIVQKVGIKGDRLPETLLKEVNI